MLGVGKEKHGASTGNLTTIVHLGVTVYWFDSCRNENTPVGCKTLEGCQSKKTPAKIQITVYFLPP